MQGERHLTFKAQLENVPAVCDFVVGEAKAAGLDQRAAYHCQLAVDEACTNIIQHGLPDDVEEDDALIEVTTGVDDRNSFVIMISDPAPEFNPLDHEEPDPKATLQQREKVGGWGIYFIKKLMDLVEYRHVHGKNRLTLHKFIRDGDLPEGITPVTDITVSSKALAKNYWQINLAGRLDSNTSITLEEILQEALIDNKQYRLIVNLDGVEYISSSGLKALVSAWRTARDNGGDVLLTNLQARIQEIFDMIGFDMMFNIYDTPADALDADPLG